MAEPTEDAAAAAPGPLEEALASVGDRWTLLVVAALLDGPRRFGDLQRALPDIAPNVLSARLRHLDEQGLVVTQLYSKRPPRYVYELSSAGADLAGPLRLLADWGARHRDADPPRHEACGTPLEARWYCPTCERPVDDDQAAADEVHYA
ncbi:MAG TPA: helix-turn-helix domain-containing protein [Solirubrobacteraceae bacterium]|jgi:DNA-binding HxlR family transcriptional regulator|nr:helix-turn-helix domain-containing protein [Solirubrobacteraceae bacterium]